MASPNNPMRVLIKKWREGVERRQMYFGDDTAKKLYARHADELEAALADTGELVSRINYLVETEIAKREAHIRLTEWTRAPFHAWPNVGDDPQHPYPQDWVAEILQYRNKRIAELERQP